MYKDVSSIRLNKKEKISIAILLFSICFDVVSKKNTASFIGVLDLLNL